MSLPQMVLSLGGGLTAAVLTGIMLVRFWTFAKSLVT